MSVDNCEVARQVAQGFKTLEALTIQGISRGCILPPDPLNVNSLSLLFSWITRIALQNATDKQLPKRDSGATLPQIQSI